MNLKANLLKNSTSGLIQIIIQIAVTFTSIPIFIRLLGTEAYGVYAAVGIVGNLNIFTNLGLNSALIKFIAEQGDTRDTDYDILVSVFLISVILLPLSILVYIPQRFYTERYFRYS